MSNLKREHRSINQLRGKAGKAAEDARLLAEIAKNKPIPVDYSAIPEEVLNLADKNLEDATIIFSQQAIQLFTQMLAGSVELAVNKAMEEMEGRMEDMVARVVSQKLTDTMMYASSAMSNLLTGMLPKQPVDLIPESSDTSIDNVVTLDTRRKAKEEQGDVSQEGNTPDNESVTPKPTTKKMKRWEALLQVFVDSYPHPVKISYAPIIANEVYGVDIGNVYSTMDYLIKSGKPIERIDKLGFYIHKP